MESLTTAPTGTITKESTVEVPTATTVTEAAATVPSKSEASLSRDKKSHLLSIPGEHRFRMENLAFGIDVWYRRLATVTFETEFEPLTRAQGLAIVAFYKTRFNGSRMLTAAHVSVLLDLEIRLDSLLKAHFPAGAFMRLSDRSPKDADPLDKSKIWKEYLQQLDLVRRQAAGEEIKAQGSGSEDEGNLKMIAIGRVNFMRVSNGAEAMSLLLTSERVFSDCLDWLEYGEPVMIALRHFEPEITMENEFRAFVYKNHLTAISQYDHYTFYPLLEAKKSHLKELIIAEWCRIHPLVGEESYCMDFAYISSSDKVKLIEISPFLPCTGPACFNWKQDIHVLAPADICDNKSSIEFRTILHPRANMEEVIEANWDGRWNSRSVPYFSTYAIVMAQGNTPFLAPSPASSGGILSGIRGLFSSSSKKEVVPANIDVSEWLLNARSKYIQQISLPPAPSLTHRLFVYGTLKTGFHWNKKFLSRAKLYSKARTVQHFPLVVGQCGVPYLLGDMPDEGKQLVGELFLVDDELLAGMDDYEGVSKNYYERREIQVTADMDAQVYSAFVYILPSSTKELQELEPIEEYSQEIHDRYYKPIQHIQVKQMRYLGMLDTYVLQT